MSKRVVLMQAGIAYRFLRIDARPDGSLVLITDRDPSPLDAVSIGEDGQIVPITKDAGEIRPHYKASYHTTGQINLYARGDLTGIIYNEPLSAVTRPNFVAVYSVPTVTALDKVAEGESGAIGELVIPDGYSGRISFELAIAPKSENPPERFGARLNFELYDLWIVQSDLNAGPELEKRFIFGHLNKGQFATRQRSPADAELEFHRKVRGDAPPIYWDERTGIYTVMAAVPMRVAPTFDVQFDRSDLAMEPIKFDANAPVTHKVKFWITRKASRVKTEDLRRHILSLKMDAEDHS